VETSSARRAGAIIISVGLLGLAACSDDSSAGKETSSTTATVTDATLAPPKGLPAFYGAPDPIPDAKPGTLLRSEKIDSPALKGTAYRVMYSSESLRGDPIVVTGLIAVPDGPAPAGGFPVLAWAHGTTGIADECAPSLGAIGQVPVAQQLLDAGYVVAATDYEGLGTPGRHPYIVGESEARGVIDSVRAAGQLDGVETSDQYVVWGHSQGGHAAMFSLHIADEWAPELKLVGVVAGAPPSQFDLLYSVLQRSPFRYYLVMASAGINAAYGDDAAPLDAVIEPAGVEAVDLVDQGCDLGALTKDLDFSALLGPDPATIPSWAKLLKENDPGKFTEAAPEPLLVIHGGSDEQIPVAASALMFGQLCAVHQDMTRWVYPGQSHAGVIGPSLTDMLTWIGHRFAGDPTPDPMVPTGQDDVQVQSCPAS
jgi:acetyl esterase/lipase